MLNIKEKFEVVELLGIKALFTEERIRNTEVPKGLYKYELRESDDPDTFIFASLEEEVYVNHAGTILSVTPIDLGTNSYIDFSELDDDDCPGFDGTYMSIEDYFTYNPTCFSDKKRNMEYWDSIDNLSEKYIKNLSSLGFDGNDFDESGSDIIYLGKKITEFATELLKTEYDYSFPYVEGDY